MKAEALEEADRCRKHQGSDKGKGEGAIVDLPFVLIIRAKKTRQEQDRHPRSNDGQSEQGLAERRTLTLNADSNDGENRGEIEEYERGSAPISELVLKGLPVQGTPPQKASATVRHSTLYVKYKILIVCHKVAKAPGDRYRRRKERSPDAAGRTEVEWVRRTGVMRLVRPRPLALEPLCSWALACAGGSWALG